MKKLLMYGAGSIGRGFIGPLFSAAGYEIVFVDVDTGLVKLLNNKRGYSLKIMADPPYEQPVANVRAVHGLDEEAVVQEIAACDIIAVSLGAAVLPKVAPCIAQGLVQRQKRGASPLNILLCENLKDAAKHMHGWLESALLGDSRSVLSECGLVEAAIGRMVPNAAVDENRPETLSLAVEEYGFLPVDKAAFAGEIPDIPFLHPYSPFSFYEERKLYMHNMGHACCAYLGMLRGYTTIAQAMDDPYLHLFVKSAMIEAASMLSIKYGIAFAEIHNHAEDLLYRFRNHGLGDTCERVARDPLRKLASGDRFAGALCACFEYGINAVYISLGFAAALFSLTDNEEKARKIAVEHSKLSRAPLELVLELFVCLKAKPDFAALTKSIQKIKARMEGMKP